MRKIWLLLLLRHCPHFIFLWLRSQIRPATWYYPTGYTTLFPFTQSLFPLCDLVWIIPTDLFSNWLKFSFSVSRSLANSFSYQILWYCGFQWLSFFWDFSFYLSSKIPHVYYFSLSVIHLHTHNIFLHDVSVKFNSWIIWGLYLLIVFSFDFWPNFSAASHF